MLELNPDDSQRSRADVFERVGRPDGQPPRAALRPGAAIDLRPIGEVLDEVMGPESGLPVIVCKMSLIRDEVSQAPDGQIVPSVTG